MGQGVPDELNTLIYTITRHFIGNPSNVTTRIHNQLSNLRCPTLSDYRWYEDVFTTTVMHKSDCNSPFWKEKFINGLPSLFAHKIRENLSNSSGVIEYDDLTYGHISSVIRREGLKMCIDMKIQNQANRDKRKAKYEVGNFRTQYDLPSIVPSKRKSREKNTLGKEQPLGIIEVIRSPVTSIEMVSIRKARNPEITIKAIVREKIQHKKHLIRKIVNVISVARKVISRMSVNPKLRHQHPSR